MKVSPILARNRTSFCSSLKEQKQEANPISKFGERSLLFKTTVGAGVVFGLKALLTLFEDSSAIEEIYKFVVKLLNKNQRNATEVKKQLRAIGAFGLVTMGFVAIMATIYTAFKAPEVMYKGKVNAFTKEKDMDVYIKGNGVEKELYNQMNDKAKSATAEEKEILSQQYLKLKAAKNQTPDFIQNK